jgi:hypothetical protein
MNDGNKRSGLKGLIEKRLASLGNYLETLLKDLRIGTTIQDESTQEVIDPPNTNKTKEMLQKVGASIQNGALGIKNVVSYAYEHIPEISCALAWLINILESSNTNDQYEWMPRAKKRQYIFELKRWKKLVDTINVIRKI